MKYTFILCALVACLVPGCFGSAQPTSTHDYLFKEGMLNNPVVKEILAITQTPHDGSLESIYKTTQGKIDNYPGWIRKGERWDAENIHEDKRNNLLPLFRTLGYVDSLNAINKEYQYIIVLGSLAENVRKRLAFFLKEWDRGVRAQEIILLGSARPLNEKLETKDLLINDQSILPFRPDWHFDGTLPTTEYEMMKFVTDQADIPHEIKQHIKIFDTPMKQDGNRPNTQDTINTWLSTNPAQGQVLAISHQPYVHYQHSVIRSMLPSSFMVETIGSAAKPNERIAMYLDSLAREIYQEYLDAQKR